MFYIYVNDVNDKIELPYMIRNIYVKKYWKFTMIMLSFSIMFETIMQILCDSVHYI